MVENEFDEDNIADWIKRKILFLWHDHSNYVVIGLILFGILLLGIIFIIILVKKKMKTNRDDTDDSPGIFKL